MQDKDTDKELEQNVEELSEPDITSDTDNPASIEETVDESGQVSDDNIEETAQEIKEDTVKVQEQNLPENTSDVDELSDENYAQEMITVRPVKFQQFELVEPNRAIKRNLDIMQDVSMHISVELGRTKSTIKEVMDIGEGSIVELDKIAGEQVEIYVNNKLVAKGEVIVIEDKFGVRVTSTNLPKVVQ